MRLTLGHPLRRFMLVSVALLLTGCAARPGLETSGQTGQNVSAGLLTRADREFIFARERPELAAYARDYLTLLPIDVNSAGTHQLYLYCYIWSTIDKRSIRESDGQFQLVADGRQIALRPAQASPQALGVATPPLPLPSHAATTLLVPIDRERLEFLGNARTVFVLRTADGLSERFELWNGKRSSMREFLQSLDAAR